MYLHNNLNLLKLISNLDEIVPMIKLSLFVYYKMHIAVYIK